MNIKVMYDYRQAFWVAYLISLFILFNFLTGCETSQRTYRTTSEISTADEAAAAERAEATDADIEKSRTTTVETTTDEEPRGIIGTTWHFIGQVLALPFKLIAGAIEFVF